MVLFVTNLSILPFNLHGYSAQLDLDTTNFINTNKNEMITNKINPDILQGLVNNLNFQFDKFADFVENINLKKITDLKLRQINDILMNMTIFQYMLMKYCYMFIHVNEY